jgi:putative spermidine/putrescine transport system substrate-binding protein
MLPRSSLAGAVMLTLLSMAIVACGGSPGGSKRNAKMPTSIDMGEGQLNVIAWEGYAQPQWVKPLEKQTGCQVNAKCG